MFTAIVFTAVGLMILEKTGVIQAENLFVPPAFLGAAALGGALVGIGFAVGGYCPGTSVVGFVSGRLDAGIFLIGLLIGTWIFAGLFDQTEFLTTMGEYVKAETLPEAFNASDLTINTVMILAAVGVFLLGSYMEKHSRGPVTAEEAVNGPKS